MGKRKGDKSFMSLSPNECVGAYKALLDNATKKYNDSTALSEIGSYGSATSLLILSMEESMKAFVLFMDSKGFEFRKKTKGISNLFDNHTLRYPLAMSLSIIMIFGKDLKNTLLGVKQDPSQILKLRNKKELAMELFFEYIQKRLLNVMEEITWFSKAEIYRQDGFYVDYVDELLTPLNATQNDYQDIKYRIDNLNELLRGLFESFDIKDEKHQEQIEKIRLWFDKKDKKEKTIYDRLGEQIVKFKDRKTDAFGLMNNFFTNFLTDLNNRKK